MKKIMILSMLLMLGMYCQAQETDTKEKTEVLSPEDFKKLEPAILKGIEWIHNTPVSENKEQRKEINGLLMKWMSETPTVSIAIMEGLVPLDCPECMISFMSGWTKYSLENNYSKDNLRCAQAGVERTIEFYKKNQSDLAKSKDVENLIKLQKKGKLEAYIADKFKNME